MCFGVGEPGLDRGVGEPARVESGFDGAAGGPVQAVVAVAFGLGSDPCGELAEVAGGAAVRPGGRPGRLEQPGGGLPVEASGAPPRWSSSSYGWPCTRLGGAST